MWRYFAGGAGALVLAFAAMFLFRGSAAPEVKVPPAPVAAAGEVQEALPDEAPRAADKTREQKRFDRLDKDKNDAVSRDEFLNLRRRAFAKLDTNGDGRLSFDEWAVRTTTRFAGADKDKSGTLTRAEFATTAPKRRPAQPRCACPKPAAAKKAPSAPVEDEGEGGEE
ncbi:EF-hand domain-containing protein [Sphingomonas sp. AOB5]|uniref:EF-hand domain-containing protein n=1 Tax=Sphingomonas sp. AOB5 TaxID=3034017 RepID=UPI0023F81B0F|nr:EF-hand domain-containing protein [Sphingomonas sp. AOB5]MDF7774512.1 EF-hand domain-containing protein [Sphingomonas sp. AOB5]